MSQVLKSAGGRVSSGPEPHTGAETQRKTGLGEAATSAARSAMLDALRAVAAEVSPGVRPISVDSWLPAEVVSQVLGAIVAAEPEPHTGSETHCKAASGEPAARLHKPAELAEDLFDAVALLRLSIQRVDFLENTSQDPDDSRALHELQRVLRIVFTRTEATATALFNEPTLRGVCHE